MWNGFSKTVDLIECVGSLIPRHCQGRTSLKFFCDGALMVSKVSFYRKILLAASPIVMCCFRMALTSNACSPDIFLQAVNLSASHATNCSRNQPCFQPRRRHRFQLLSLLFSQWFALSLVENCCETPGLRRFSW